MKHQGSKTLKKLEELYGKLDEDNEKFGDSSLEEIAKDLKEVKIKDELERFVKGEQEKENELVYDLCLKKELRKELEVLYGEFNRHKNNFLCGKAISKISKELHIDNGTFSKAIKDNQSVKDKTYESIIRRVKFQLQYNENKEGLESASREVSKLKKEKDSIKNKLDSRIKTLTNEKEKLKTRNNELTDENENKGEKLNTLRDNLNKAAKDINSLNRSRKLLSFLALTFLLLMLFASIQLLITFRNLDKKSSELDSTSKKLSRSFFSIPDSALVPIYLPSTPEMAKKYNPGWLFEGEWDVPEQYILPLNIGLNVGVESNYPFLWNKQLYYVSKKTDILMHCIKSAEGEQEGKIVDAYEKLESEIWYDRSVAKKIARINWNPQEALRKIDSKDNDELEKLCTIESHLRSRIEMEVAYLGSDTIKIIVKRTGEVLDRNVTKVNSLWVAAEEEMERIVKSVIADTDAFRCQDSYTIIGTNKQIVNELQKDGMKFGCTFRMNKDTFNYVKNYKLVKLPIPDRLLELD